MDKYRAPGISIKIKKILSKFYLEDSIFRIYVNTE